ncbi:hypothetical protein TorRG33x02_145890 [Trema orientale]|uniref:Uncharacterized protein n=1 Tax=Trema orientale TaxID=63057 RepID=A0A2P5EVP4_TREOI|nr:hypothetical protein TorRG33x02_145890 [Trema orientale]
MKRSDLGQGVCIWVQSRNLGLQGDLGSRVDVEMCAGLSSRGKRDFLGLHEGLDMAMFHRQGPTHEDGGGGVSVIGFAWTFESTQADWWT